jgi:hypothetical protein
MISQQLRCATLELVAQPKEPVFDNLTLRREHKMKTRLLLIVLSAALLATLVVGEALAAGQWYWYDVTVPSFGRSTTTNNQTKVATGQASVSSNLIGADYDLNIRLELVDNTSKSNWYKINDGHCSDTTTQLLKVRLSI